MVKWLIYCNRGETGSVLFGKQTDIFVPDKTPFDEAVSRVTHMGIGAHQDDLEIMALDGILRCFRQDDKWFMGITVSDGAGSPRSGIYERYSDEEMQKIRVAEQRKAAAIGEYAACVQLMYTSKEIKGAAAGLADDIAKAVRLARPEVIYTHNLADKHDTHVAVALRVIEAIRLLPRGFRPEKLYGCEVWRGLDWLCDSDKVVFDVSGHPSVSAALIGVFDTQVAGGKRYDRASLGRRRANATFLASHFIDAFEEAVFGVDMSAFITDDSLEPEAFIGSYIRGFEREVLERVGRLNNSGR